MINVYTEGKCLKDYTTFIDECIMALFPEDAQYDIYIEAEKFVDDDGTHAGFCIGDSKDCVISLATHWVYEDGEEIAYEPHELASNLAHELVHAKQFCKEQINMIDNVWKHNNLILNCDEVDYEELPWEVEAYTYEVFLTDILWGNV
jgi:hypothetical protein